MLKVKLLANISKKLIRSFESKLKIIQGYVLKRFWEGAIFLVYSIIKTKWSIFKFIKF